MFILFFLEYPREKKVVKTDGGKLKNLNEVNSMIIKSRQILAKVQKMPAKPSCQSDSKVYMEDDTVATPNSSKTRQITKVQRPAKTKL